MQFQGEELSELLPHLRRYAFALTGSKDRADDLVQSGLERALRFKESYRVNSGLRSWLLSIIHNLFIDDVRRNRRDFSLKAELINAPSFDIAGQEASIQLSELEQALRELPSFQLSALLLVSLEGLPYEQVAEITGVSVGTVRSRVSRARAALMSRLNGSDAARPRATDTPVGFVGLSDATVATLAGGSDGTARRGTGANALIVEDDAIVARDMADIVEEVGYNLAGICATGEAALSWAHRTRPALILADIKLSDGWSGIHVVSEIRKRLDSRVIFVTAYPRHAVDIDDTVFAKPFVRDELKAAISQDARVS